MILESPPLPVSEGETVTLHCLKKTTSTNKIVVFYKDDDPVQSSPAEQMRFNVSKSDEGVYRCSISDVGMSPVSWLVVRGETVLQTEPARPFLAP